MSIAALVTQLNLSSGHLQDSAEEPYRKSSVAPANIELTSLLAQYLENEAELVGKVSRGVNITADSFYSSQGRIDANFFDENDRLVNDLSASYANAKSMEMESFQLLHLAHCSSAPIIAAAAAIVVANRCTAEVIDADMLHSMELAGGRGCLEAITKVVLS